MENQDEIRDRSCEKCFYFIEGEIETKIEIGFFRKKTVKEKKPNVCGYLNRMPLPTARVTQQGDQYCFPSGISSPFPIPLSYKIVEGPCGAEGKYWKRKKVICKA